MMTVQPVLRAVLLGFWASGASSFASSSKSPLSSYSSPSPTAAAAFLLPPSAWSAPSRTRRPPLVRMATLSGQPWRLQIDVTATDSTGRVVERPLSLAVNFEVDEGYEPPQGRIVPVMGAEGSDDDAGKFVDLTALSRWQLSEDPDDRKDGLWIWGLFEEPLYPFVLMNIVLKDISVPGSDTAFIPGFTCYGQISHTCDRKTGAVTLSDGALTVRNVQRVKADLVGLATADIAESEAIGSIRFTPLLRS